MLRPESRRGFHVHPPPRASAAREGSESGRRSPLLGLAAKTNGAGYFGGGRRAYKAPLGSRPPSRPLVKPAKFRSCYITLDTVEIFSSLPPPPPFSPSPAPLLPVPNPMPLLAFLQARITRAPENRRMGRWHRGMWGGTMPQKDGGGLGEKSPRCLPARPRQPRGVCSNNNNKKSLKVSLWGHGTGARPSWRLWQHPEGVGGGEFPGRGSLPSPQNVATSREASPPP